jgi:hypothetical protein
MQQAAADTLRALKLLSAATSSHSTTRAASRTALHLAAAARAASQQMPVTGIC